MQNDDTSIAPESSHFVSAASLRVRLDWFNKLRWGAAAGIPAAVLVAVTWLDIPLPVLPLLAVCGVLCVLNWIYVMRNRSTPPVNFRAELRLVKLEMLGDLLALTWLLSLSGGITNPFLFVYVIHVIIASLLFKGREILKITCLGIALFTGEVLLEYLGWLPHYSLLGSEPETLELPTILSTLASFWLVMLFAAYIGSSIMKHNRAIKNELVDRQNDLVMADQAKMDFFRFVTDEIKNPVAKAQDAVKTVIETRDVPLPEAAAELLQQAMCRLHLASEIVKDLADLTRGGQLKPEDLQPVDLNELVAQVVKVQLDLAERRRERLEVELPPEPLIMTTSRSMVEKIVANLLHNAICYNKDGGLVQLRLSMRGSVVRLEICDEGIGIAPEDTRRIFEEFYRAPAAQEMSDLGTGLGLPIVKRLTSKLGGSLAVRSEPGRGSTFAVELPTRMYE